MTPSLSDRFWSRVDKTPDCWLWTGPFDRRGYGMFSIIRGRSHAVGAHRMAYELEVGPIPAGLTIDHLCRVRNCVRPAHLEAVSNRENVVRGQGKPCEHGSRTFSGCRICKAEYMAEYMLHYRQKEGQAS